MVSDYHQFKISAMTRLKNMTLRVEVSAEWSQDVVMYGLTPVVSSDSEKGGVLFMPS